MMQKSSNTFLKRSKTCSKSLMPALTPATSHLLGGPCLITSLDDYRMVPLSTTQPMHRVFEFPTRQTSSDQEDGSDLQASAHRPAKKKRLTGDQVKFLECNFNLDSKLEPERKSQMAYELGLQPRQVAIWYQNKRARSKTKQLEQKFEALKEEYEEILAEKRRLEAETDSLNVQDMPKSCFADRIAKCYEECYALMCDPVAYLTTDLLS